MDSVYRQGARIGVGLVALLVLSQVPPHVLRIWTPWLYALGVLLLLATWLVGTGRSTDRWLDLGLFRFQPSEIMKLAVPMMMAAYLHPRRLPPDLRAILVSVGILAVPAVLIARQPDLGTALLVAASGAFVLFLSGLQWRVIFGWPGSRRRRRRSGGVMRLPAPARADLSRARDGPPGHAAGTSSSRRLRSARAGCSAGWLHGAVAAQFIPERHTDFILAVLSESSAWWACCCCSCCTCSSSAAACTSTVWPGRPTAACSPAASA
jgi:rod shape determining protein RodA